MTVHLQDILDAQRIYFASGQTCSVDFRSEQLRKLKANIASMETQLLAALKADLNKPEFEGYTSEVGFVYEEIGHALKHLRSWSKPRKFRTPFILQPSSSYIYPQPKGMILIIGPWNYPVQLVLSPLVAALAAGNVAVIKPSEIATHTEKVIETLIAQTFTPEICCTIIGGITETQELLSQKFDHIFFTGSTKVGRIVMQAAADTLTPVTLELGGKSPCIVDKNVNLKITARRIAWGKFYNTGQTCVAPDYLLVHRDIKDALIEALRSAIREFFGENPQKSPAYGRIINLANFERLAAMLSDGRVVAGGQSDANERYIAPTLLDQITLHSKVMEEEIFGPILPIIEFQDVRDAIDIIKQRPNPLACYVFTENRAFAQRVIDTVPFGGGCINNTLIHLAVPDLPFGGIGASGMGSYHGEAGFAIFSHHNTEE